MVLSCHPLPAKRPRLRDVGKFVHSAQVEVEADNRGRKDHDRPENSGEPVGRPQTEIRSGVIVVDLGVITLSATVRGVQIKTLAPGKVVLGIQTVPAALVVRHLQAVILGSALICCGDNVLNIWKGSGKRAELIAIRSRRTDSGCVDGSYSVSGVGNLVNLLRLERVTYWQP